MDDNSELIRKVYLSWRAGLIDHDAVHPDEEILACFVDGLLPEQEQIYVKAHLLRCPRCAEAIAAQAFFQGMPSEEAALNREQIEKLKRLVPAGVGVSAEVEVSWKMGVFRLLHYSEGFFLQRYAAAGLLRGEDNLNAPVRDITLRKDFPGMGVEIKIAGLNDQRFSISVRIRSKIKQAGSTSLRAALFSSGKEVESRQFLRSCAVFAEVIPGDYLLEINAGSGKRLAVARLVLNID